MKRIIFKDELNPELDQPIRVSKLTIPGFSVHKY